MYSYLGITSHIDLPLVLLYLFWAFFAGLIYYLHREGKREGYPLVTDRHDGRVSVVGFPGVPAPKTFNLAHGEPAVAPNTRAERSDLALRPTALFPGAPNEPTGDPMLDGVGPGSWANRADTPDLTIDGAPKIVPLRAAPGFFLSVEDPDPRGYEVVAGDRKFAGKVTDVWVDRSEYLARYFEVEVAGGRTVLLPVNFSKVDDRRGHVTVRAIYADQFARVPALASPDQVTLLEEEKIVAYYGGGILYAHPGRTESLL